MGNYEIRFRASVEKDLRSIPEEDVRRILKTIDPLGNNPRPPQSIKLTSSEQYRVRCGTYRILYEITDSTLIVCIVKVAHRKDVYR